MAGGERGRAVRLGWSSVAGDEAQPGDPSRQAVPAEDPPHAVRADRDPAPPLLGQRGADPPRPKPGVAEGEGEHPLLDDLTGLVGHPRRPTLAGPEHLEARAQDRAPPAVVGRRVNAEDAARRADVAELGGQAEQPQPESEEDVIIDHGAAPPAHRFEHDKHGDAAPLVTRRACARVSGDLGDCSA